MNLQPVLMNRLLRDAIVGRRLTIISMLVESRHTYLQDLDSKTLEDILNSSDSHLLVNVPASVLASNNFERDHYYILLRELLLKKEDLQYYFNWIVVQCAMHLDALEYRRVVTAVEKSPRSKKRVVHTSSLFTAYRGFLLLATSNDSGDILSLLSSEGASQEGLQLAGMLIGAYLGRERT